MGNFWQLVRNENMKIYRRLGTWIMLGITALIPFGVVLFMYGIDLPGMSSWSAMLVASQTAIPIVTIFAVVKAAEAVAGEFTWGTIKLLLIRPWKRSVILLSKYLSVLMFALLFMAVAFVLSYISGVLLFGNSGMGGESFSDQSPWLYMLKYYGLRFITVITIVTFGFMLSSAFRSSSLAIGLTIFLLMSGSLVSSLFSISGSEWVKYLLFAHLDLTSYMSGGGPFFHHETTLGFSIAVLVVYIALFNLVSWVVFCKRDVSA